MKKDSGEKYWEFREKFDNNYNRTRYFELLKKKSLKSFSTQDSWELAEYSAMVASHLNWENRDYLVELLNDFRNGELDDFGLAFAIEKKLCQNGDAVEVLEGHFILLTPSEKSKDFQLLLTELEDLCEYKMEDGQFKEMEFKNNVEEIYLRLQKYLNQDSSNR